MFRCTQKQIWRHETALGIFPRVGHGFAAFVATSALDVGDLTWHGGIWGCCPAAREDPKNVARTPLHSTLCRSLGGCSRTGPQAVEPHQGTQGPTGLQLPPGCRLGRWGMVSPEFRCTPPSGHVCVWIASLCQLAFINSRCRVLPGLTGAVRQQWL